MFCWNMYLPIFFVVGIFIGLAEAVPTPTSGVDVLYDCLYPGHGFHSRTNITQEYSSPGTIARYICDAGYLLIGPIHRTCNESGHWTPAAPMCGVNVATFQNITSVSPNVDMALTTNKGWAIVDAQYAVCSYADASQVSNSSWTIDLMQRQSVDIITLIFGDYTDVAIAFHYGNTESEKEPIHTNMYTFAEWPNRAVHFQGNLASPGATTYEFKLNHPIMARYITIMAFPSKLAILKLCEALIVSKSALSYNQCQNDRKSSPFPPTTATLDNRICYSFFHTSSETTFDKADDQCQSMLNGSLIEINHYDIERLVTLHMDIVFRGRQSNYWIGGKYDPLLKKFNSWAWKNSTSPIHEFYWGNGQPNMGKGEAACLSISSIDRWQWNDSPCLDRLNFICQHLIRKCGSPDQKEISMSNVINTDVGSTVTYSCPTGFHIDGHTERACKDDGHWSNDAPTCLNTTEHNRKEKMKADKEALGTGALIAIIVGIVTGLLIIIAVIVWVAYRKKSSGSHVMKYDKKAESAETLDVDGSKTKTDFGHANYSSTVDSESAKK